MSRKWTVEELEYLEDHWGTLSAEAIGKKLGRTKLGIQTKAQRLNLGAFTLAGDYITLYALIPAIYGENARMCGHTTKLWIEKGLNVKRKKVINTYVKCVKISDFWEFAEKNQSLLDFSNFEENNIGLEPEWVKNKRKADIEERRLLINTPWTDAEDEKLKRMLAADKTLLDAQKELRRTAAAIIFRAKEKGFEGKFRREQSRWTEEEMQMIKSMILRSYGYAVISHRINRSEKSIRGAVAKMTGTEHIDRARERLKNG